MVDLVPHCVVSMTAAFRLHTQRCWVLDLMIVTLMCEVVLAVPRLTGSALSCAGVV